MTTTAARQRRAVPAPLLFVFLEKCGCPLGWVKGTYAETDGAAWHFVATETSGGKQAPLRARGVTAVRVGDRREALVYMNAVAAGRPCPHAKTGTARLAAVMESDRNPDTMSPSAVEKWHLNNPDAFGSVRAVA